MGGPQWRQTKSQAAGGSGTEMRRVCEREGGREKGGQRKGSVSPSAEQKNGVRESCERGEIAFSFHFTRLPFLVQPSSFTSRPLLHTLTQTDTPHTHIWLKHPILNSGLRGNSKHACLSPRAPPSDPGWLLQRTAEKPTSCGLLIGHCRHYVGHDIHVRPPGALTPVSVHTSKGDKLTPALT